MKPQIQIMMLSVLIFIFSLLASGSARATEAPTVVLVSSIQSPKIWYKAQSWDLNVEFEQDFEKAFANSGYRVVIKRDATAYDLAQILHAPENVGVFWVSHAASAPQDSQGAPLSLSNIILDKDGVDVKDVFQQVNPNLRWLSVVGCEAKPILDGFKANGYYDSNPNLTIQDYETVVDAVPGFIYALNASMSVLGVDPRSTSGHWSVPASPQGRDALRNPVFVTDPHSDIPTIFGTPSLLNTSPETICPRTEGLVLKIDRTTDSSEDPSRLTEVMVYLGDHLLTVLPKPTPSQSQVESVSITKEVLSAELARTDGSLEIQVSSGIAGLPARAPEFGSFGFQSELGQWDLFADSTGKPIGLTAIIYAHHGAVQSLNEERLSEVLEPYCLKN